MRLNSSRLEVPKWEVEPSNEWEEEKTNEQRIFRQFLAAPFPRNSTSPSKPNGQFTIAPEKRKIQNIKRGAVNQWKKNNKHQQTYRNKKISPRGKKK